VYFLSNFSVTSKAPTKYFLLRRKRLLKVVHCLHDRIQTNAIYTSTKRDFCLLVFDVRRRKTTFMLCVLKITFVFLHTMR